MTPPKDDPTETDGRNGPIEAGGMRIVRPTDPQSWISEAKEKEAEEEKTARVQSPASQLNDRWTSRFWFVSADKLLVTTLIKQISLLVIGAIDLPLCHFHCSFVSIAKGQDISCKCDPVNLKIEYCNVVRNESG